MWQYYPEFQKRLRQNIKIINLIKTVIFKYEGGTKMILIKPAWDSENHWRAVKVVEKMKNEVKLARVAKEAQTWEARKAAVKKITD